MVIPGAFLAWQTGAEQRRLRAEYERLAKITGDLEITDPTKVENRWEIYLPSGQYRLCLATRGIDQQGFAPVAKSNFLGPGKHRIELGPQRDVENPRVVVSRDGVRILEIEESKDWYPSSGSMGGSEFSENTHLAAHQPVVLFRRRFSRSDATGQITTPTGPTEGIMLWIEPSRSE